MAQIENAERLILTIIELKLHPRIVVKVLVFVMVYLHCIGSFAQKDSGSSLTISGYADAYYAHYTDSIGAGKVQKFGAISPISNNIGLNIAQLTAQYTSTKIRSTITLQYGDLPSAAWSPVYNFVQEANIGVKLSKTLWIDAGFFKTHIGTEALLPKDNICSSVSIITFYEPWWQAGARLTYTPSDKFTGALYMVDGYNQFVAINKKKAVGVALTENISDWFNMGYYNLLSDNTPDDVSMAHWRLLNNFVINMDVTKKFKMQFGVDFITQQNSDVTYLPSSITYATAYAGSLILSAKCKLTNKFSIYARLEGMNDPDGVLNELDTFYANNPSFSIIGETLGLEYKPTDNSYVRLETRELEMRNDQNLFYSDGNYTATRSEIMLNMGVSF